MFAPLAWLLAAFYALWASYGFAIVALTTTVAVYYLISNLFRVAQQHLIRRLHPPPAASESAPG